MRVGIDVRYLSHGLVGGVHTYMKQFIPALLAEATSEEIVLYADTKSSFELQQLPPRVIVRLLPYRGPLSSVSIDLRELRRAMQQDQIEIAHFAGNYGFAPRQACSVVTLQDEINLLPLSAIIRGHNKQPRTIAMMTYLHFCTRAAIRQADLVITVSEYSKRQICRNIAIEPERVIAVHHACPADIARISDEQVLDDVRERLGLKRPFILAEAFKNPGVIVRAWERLPADLRNRYEIIFFSRSPDVLPVVHEAIAKGYARMFVRPARSDLSALYNLAQSFVFPSWIEGFGIPLVEAMTCGAPVIASDRGSIPEVLGDAGLIIDAEDDAALAQHLEQLLCQADVADDLRQRGFRRAKAFSWQKTARRVLELYEDLGPFRSATTSRVWS